MNKLELVRDIDIHVRLPELFPQTHINWIDAERGMRDLFLRSLARNALIAIGHNTTYENIRDEMACSAVSGDTVSARFSADMIGGLITRVGLRALDSTGSWLQSQFNNEFSYQGAAFAQENSPLIHTSRWKVSTGDRRPHTSEGPERAAEKPEIA